MATYWSTAFPFDFNEDGTHYYVPFSVIFKKNISTDWHDAIKVDYSPAVYGDTSAYGYGVRCNDANDNVSCIIAYTLEETSDSYNFHVKIIFVSDTTASVSYASGRQRNNDSKINYGIPTTLTLNSQYTYNGKKVYYYLYSVNWSVVKTDGSTIINGEGTQKMSDSQYAALADKVRYFAWLVLYDSAYVNDPYNRPPEGDEPRGGRGTWDNYSDTITIDPLPAGLWGQGFISVYCPTVAELTTFANEIWKKSNREHLNDIFPGGVTSGIVSCHTLPVAPATSGSGKIVIGGYPIDNTSAAILANRFVMANFGSIPAKYTQEYFGAFVDYLNTKIALYLPYIGFVPLAPEMVINAVVSLQYKIDMFTGDCIAIVTTYRNDKFNYQGMSYMFAGNCATQIPITSQTGAGTSDIISTAVSGLATVAGGIVSGNPIGAVAAGINTVNSIVSDTSKIGFSMRSGFSGAKGQLSNQRPYLIINRPCMENGAKNNYFNLCGIPSNDYVTLGDITGFAQVMEAILADADFANATENEKTEILTALKGGIYL